MKRSTPTMADVARLAGVTSMTVSRALREGSSVSEDTRKRIISAAESLGYVIDGAAAGLKAGRTGFVGVVIPTLNNSNFAETVQGIADELAKTRRQVLLGYTNYDSAEEERIIESLLVRRPEAMVVTGREHTERAARLLSQAGIPVVEIWDIPEAPIDRVVGFSNAEAGRLMTRHLLDCGYRRIAFVGGTAEIDGRGSDRRRGYEEAMAEAGLETRILAFGEPPITIRQGAGALTSLLAQWPDLEAVLCVSDLLAFGVLMECHRRNIAVPDTLAVAGFGNYDLAECVTPGLTTVDVGARAIGASAAQLLGAAIAAPDDGSLPRIIRSDVTLIARESTAARRS